ncbi:hypothetical protein HDV62DRAFT_365091, partial [Trichoderma sp. SZMC 28011]
MTPITKAMPKKRIGSARACDWPSPAKLQAPKPPLLIPNPKSLLLSGTLDLLRLRL